jgi:hypothetical protein
VQISINVGKVIKSSGISVDTEKDNMLITSAPPSWGDSGSRVYSGNYYNEFALLEIGDLQVIVKRSELIRALDALP